VQDELSEDDTMATPANDPHAADRGSGAGGVPDLSPGGLAIETSGLVKRFGGRAAIDGVDLRVPRGVAFGFLGPNGAGKTTMIRVLLGLTRASAGSMTVLGRPMPAERAIALQRVGAIVEEPSFHRQLSGSENLRVVAAARGGDARARIGPALARVGLSELLAWHAPAPRCRTMPAV
jgi:ABC-type multidrug transport system ATPase subunit